MRAILVVNPKATTTSELSRDVLVRALRSEVDLTVEYTRRRGHAADLARRARDQHVDVVVTLGGDGTVNEVINGLLRDDDAAGPGPRCRPWPWCPADPPTSSPGRSACPATRWRARA